MILGIGVDITKVARFRKWLFDKNLLKRFFNDEEIPPFNPDNVTDRRVAALCQHVAARFAAKEAFSKALGTGLSGFELRDVYIRNSTSGAPKLCVTGSATTALEKLCKKHNTNISDIQLHASLSHEKEFAIAFVTISL